MGFINMNGYVDDEDFKITINSVQYPLNTQDEKREFARVMIQEMNKLKIQNITMRTIIRNTKMLLEENERIINDV